MQFFGVGIMELGVILTLAVLVIGPDRVPGFAADLAKWIRQARSYANHMMKDFNEVVSEVQKEAGSSAEDWKEIASVFNRHTGDVMREVGKAGTAAEKVIPNEGMLNGASNGSTVTPPPLAGATSATNGSNGGSATPAISGYGSNPPFPYEGAPPSVGETQSPGLGDSGGAPKEELAWYVPERRHRRRALDY